MADERDPLPVLTVTDKEGYLIEIGDPAGFTNANIKSYLEEGHEIRIIQFKEYAAKPRKWYWNNPKSKKLL